MLVVIAFVAVWLTIPSEAGVDVASVSYPAKLLRYGTETGDIRSCVKRVTGPPSSRPLSQLFLREGTCVRYAVTFHTVDPGTMKNHALVFFGGLAAVVILIGVAFGAASRKNPPPSTEAVSAD